MLKQDTAILTTTLYKSTEELRFHLACQMIGNAIGAGHEVLVIDNSPDPAVRKAFLRIGAGAFKQLSPPGMGNQKRDLFGAAWLFDGKKHDLPLPEFFLWTEPEKPDLIRSIPQIIAPLERYEADIVIACRTEESMRTYPEFQIESEIRMNRVYAEATGINGADPTFSPVAFTRRMLPYFMNCDPHAQYGEGAHDGYIQLYAPLKAMERGHRVATVKVDCFYPAAQKKEEGGQLLLAMKEKREMQANTITSTWLKMAKVLGLPKLQTS